MARVRKPPAVLNQFRPAVPNWRLHGRCIAALWALVLVAYSNSFRAGLVFDNGQIVSQDPRIRAATADNISLILTEGYWHNSASSGLYRPLTTFSYLLNYSVLGNGERPAGYHWVNLALHGINVSLVYALGILVFAETAPALGLAGLWGLHPLATEAVTNIVGRADLLAAFGVLAGLLCYAKSVSAFGRRRLAWLAGVMLAMAIGLFSKENAAVLPGIMLIYDLNASARATWRQRAPAYAAVLLPFAAYLLLRAQMPLRILARPADNPLMNATFWTAALTAIEVMGRYLWLFFWPARLSADYSYNAVPLFGWNLATWEDAKALFAPLLCLAAAGLAVRWLRARDWRFFFLAWFFVALFPTSNLVIRIGSIMAERLVYLPSVGLAGCVVAALCALVRRWSPRWPSVTRAGWIAFGALCLACAARTYARNFDWYDERSLWTSAVQACPESAKAHCNLGNALMHIPGRVADAIVECETALKIEPDYAEAHNNLGSALSQLPGRLPDAVNQYQFALRIKPDYAEAHYNLANAWARLPGRTPDAIGEYRAALRVEPAYPEAHNNLGLALADSGRLREAISEYREALRIRPDLAEAHNNLGNALMQLPGQLTEAIAEFASAVRFQSDYAEAHNNLGSALAQLPGRLPDAIAQYEAALRIQPGYAAAHLNLGVALVNAGRVSDALTHLEAALRVRPDLAEAHNDLGIALARSGGRLQDAIAEFETALRIQPDYAAAHVNLGDALSLVPGHLPQAIAHYQAALRIEPDPELRTLVERLLASR